jgi:hypothetical protein
MGAAEQNVLPFMHDAMGRVRIGRHAAHGIALSLAGAGVAMVVVVIIGHCMSTQQTAPLVSLATQPAPSHNGKVNGQYSRADSA